VLCGLDGAAFVKLEKRFARVLLEATATRTRAGQPRRRAAGAGPKGALPGARAQDVMGHFFGLSQPQVCARVAQLLPLVKTLMQAELPARMKSLKLVWLFTLSMRCPHPNYKIFGGFSLRCR
jgi:hypothetical protein